MSVVPPDPDGGFFASPLPSQQQQGYGPPQPPAFVHATAEGPSPFVVGAATSLALAGIAAIWLGLSMLSVIRAFGGDGPAEATFDGWFLLVNGIADIPLAYLLLRRSQAARWAVTGVCAGWLVYWLYQLTRVTHAFSTLRDVTDGDFGRVTLMVSLGLLLLAGWAALTGALLWLSGSGRHFSAVR